MNHAPVFGRPNCTRIRANQWRITLTALRGAQVPRLRQAMSTIKPTPARSAPHPRNRHAHITTHVSSRRRCHSAVTQTLWDACTDSNSLTRE